MKISIPELALVVLIGPTGAGKSTFARHHFRATEIVSSDFCRGLVADDENDQAATPAAFTVLHAIVRERLRAGRLTVIDATSVRPEDRKPLVALAREFHVLPVALVFRVREDVCLARNQARPDRQYGPHVVRQHLRALRASLGGLPREGFRHVHVFRTPEELAAVELMREPLWNNLRSETGPFDIIGDVHGCLDELLELLRLLGYETTRDEQGYAVRSAKARKLIFLGDLVDRGPDSAGVLRLVMRLATEGQALCVPGNHDIKLLRALRGRAVRVTHGLGETLAQLAGEPDEFRAAAATFIDDLVSHYVLDGGRLVVAHAGMKAEMQGRGSGRVREFALYGETTGETDEFGLPVRHNWAAEYRGNAAVIYGHTPVPEPEWINNTLNIDTGCAFGGRLTALRWPERELVHVAARRIYANPARPMTFSEATNGDSASPPAAATMPALDDMLDLNELLGKRIIDTRLSRTVTIREENGLAALEVLSRFAVDPHWLIYLPPTMSPCEASRRPNLLEHPDEALAFYRHAGVARVVCQEKHMGSRAVAIVLREPAVARRRFGLSQDAPGVIYTRTGRRFLDDTALERDLLDHVARSAATAGIWDELQTDWLCLDCELMPWSLKAQALLRSQYAAVAAAGRAGLPGAVAALQAATGRALPIAPLLERYERSLSGVQRFEAAYQRYCWPVASLADLKLAPFHVLAGERGAYVNRDHHWHMDLIRRMCDAGAPSLHATAMIAVDTADDASVAAATAWWEQLTAAGGEGMVVKPLGFVISGSRGVLQPAIKCRGPEYLRIIYGPEYDAPENIERLRGRRLGAKRALALREFALGVEGLERFVRREPLRRVHECVFGVLALESEPVDPRL